MPTGASCWSCSAYWCQLLEHQCLPVPANARLAVKVEGMRIGLGVPGRFSCAPLILALSGVAALLRQHRRLPGLLPSRPNNHQTCLAFDM